MPEELSQNELRAQRLAKLNDIKEAGLPFYPSNAFKKEDIVDVLSKPEGELVEVAGRVVLMRQMGNIAFFHIQDRSGRMQMVLNKRTFSEDPSDYKFWLKKLDLGDIVHIKGERIVTQKGEPSVMVGAITLIAKALLPPPEKWSGISDSDQVLRQRYLDLMGNRDSFDRFRKRSQIVSGIRHYLDAQSFWEVETPILQAEAGGAAATPFNTHFNALDHDFVLRISLELYLKRMLVGGFERVYEIGRNFRNEGLSRRHNPEFTMLEVYQAYSDYRGMMDLLKGMISHLCENVLGQWEFKHHDSGEIIDFKNGWNEIRYDKLVGDRVGDADFFSRSKEEKIAKADEMGVKIDPSWEEFEIVNEIYSKKIEPTLIQPTFVTHMPQQVCPLAKRNVEDPRWIDVFECIIGGMEVAPAYSELNDPIKQKEIFLEQVGEETQRFDEDFIAALEHGMPSAGGMGVGIDRLVILLTEATSIRDVLLFPTLKPLDK